MLPQQSILSPHDLCAAGFCQRQQMRIGPREHLVIIITEGYICSFCLFQTGIACGADALVALVQRQNAGILCGDFLSHRSAAIRRTIIHQKKFQLHLLGQNGIHRFPQGFRGVENRHNDTQRHGRPPFHAAYSRS